MPKKIKPTSRPSPSLPPSMRAGLQSIGREMTNMRPEEILGMVDLLEEIEALPPSQRDEAAMGLIAAARQAHTEGTSLVSLLARESSASTTEPHAPSAQ